MISALGISSRSILNHCCHFSRIYLSDEDKTIYICGSPLELETGAHTLSFRKIEIFGLILISTVLDFYSFGRLPVFIYILYM